MRGLTLHDGRPTITMPLPYTVTIAFRARDRGGVQGRHRVDSGALFPIFTVQGQAGQREPYPALQAAVALRKRPRPLPLDHAQGIVSGAPLCREPESTTKSERGTAQQARRSFQLAWWGPPRRRYQPRSRRYGPKRKPAPPACAVAAHVSRLFAQRQCPSCPASSASKVRRGAAGLFDVEAHPRHGDRRRCILEAIYVKISAILAGPYQPEAARKTVAAAADLRRRLPDNIPIRRWAPHAAGSGARNAYLSARQRLGLDLTELRRRDELPTPTALALACSVTGGDGN